jgi:Flp pilus assembly protein TadD
VPLVPLVVALATFVAFLPALRGEFVNWDDDKNFLDNPHYRGLGPAQLRWMWTTFHVGHYVPLSWMTLGLDYSLWGMDGRGYHLTNVLLHSANAALVYLLARRLLLPARVNRGEPRAGRIALMAAVAALLFSVHPLRVESVAWITERRDVLSLLFYLTSALLYLRSCEPIQSRRVWYRLSIAAFGCALLSKATAVTLPAVLLLLNVHPLTRLVKRVGSGGGAPWRDASARRVHREMAPFALLAAAAVGMTFVVLHHVERLRPPLGFAQKLAVSTWSLAFYVWKTVAPVGLAPLYAMPRDIDPRAARFLLSYAVVGALSVGAWLARRRWPDLTAAWVAFLVTVGPMLGLVQNGPQIAADRYTYFAAPWVAIFLVRGLSSLPGTLGRTAAGLAGLALVVLATLTWKQCEIWQDSTSLWTQVLQVEPDSPIAHNNMGNLLFTQMRLDDAIEHYHLAIAAAPTYAEAHNDLGVALCKQGRFRDAIVEFQQALAANPANSEAHNNWGIALGAMGRPAESIEHFRAALAINPANADAEMNLGNALMSLGRMDEAIDAYRAALRVRPDDVEARASLDRAIEEQRSP